MWTTPRKTNEDSLEFVSQSIKNKVLLKFKFTKSVGHTIDIC